MSELGNLVNNIVFLPERRLLNIVSTDARIAEEAKPGMETIAQELLQTVRSECSEGDNCEAKLDRFEQEVPEIHGAVFSIGIICGKACATCPMDVRKAL